MPDPDLSLDLRPILAQGVDPLQTVVECAGPISPGGRMTLDAPFNPLPLRRVLARLGFSSQALKLADKHWQITCQRDGLGNIEGEPTPDDCPGLPDPGAPVWRDAEHMHIDVRGLTPPLPMLAVLRLIAAVEADQQIIVHLDRDPIYLVPELLELGWTFEALAGDPGEVRLLLRRAV